MSASADVLAMAKVEVDLAAIPEGKNVRTSFLIGIQTRRLTITQVLIKWRGKPVFIRHRTADEIKEAEDIKIESLRDPQRDADRVKKPEWLVMVGTYKQPGNLPNYCFRDDSVITYANCYTFRCLHTFGMCTHWRSWRLWRMVLPLPRIPL